MWNYIVVILNFDLFICLFLFVKVILSFNEFKFFKSFDECRLYWFFKILRIKDGCGFSFKWDVYYIFLKF